LQRAGDGGAAAGDIRRQRNAGGRPHLSDTICCATNMAVFMAVFMPLFMAVFHSYFHGDFSDRPAKSALPSRVSGFAPPYY
jgi:hypothetical protein